MTGDAGLLRAAQDDPGSREPVRARDVQVDKLYRARCHRPGCGWTGGEHATFQDANADRLAHLNRHTLASKATIAVGQDGTA